MHIDTQTDLCTRITRHLPIRVVPQVPRVLQVKSRQGPKTEVDIKISFFCLVIYKSCRNHFKKLLSQIEFMTSNLSSEDLAPTPPTGSGGSRVSCFKRRARRADIGRRTLQNVAAGQGRVRAQKICDRERPAWVPPSALRNCVVELLRTEPTRAVLYTADLLLQADKLARRDWEGIGGGGGFPRGSF